METKKKELDRARSVVKIDMQIEGIDDEQVRKKVDTLLERASGDDEYYHKWSGIITRLTYGLTLATIVILLIFYFTKDYIFENYKFQDIVWILVILMILGTTTSYLWRLKWKFKVTKGWTYWRHRKEMFEASKTIMEYEAKTGKKVKIRFPAYMCIAAIIGIAAIMAIVYNSLESGDYTDFYIVMVSLAVVIWIVVAVLLWEKKIKGNVRK